MSDDNSSAAINVDGLIGPDDSDAPTEAGNPETLDQAVQSVDDIIPNETVETNDRSVVGEVKEPELEPLEEEPIDPSSLPFAADPNNSVYKKTDDDQAGSDNDQPADNSAETNAESDANTDDASQEQTLGASNIMPDQVPDISVLVPQFGDPEKVDFIKTYTAEYDDTLLRAATAINKILDSVDQAMHEKLAAIVIPEETNEFLEKAPTEGKVHSFEDVRDIVKVVMDHAVEAKEQSKAAATEAGRIYDEIQQFKKETKEQIDSLTRSE